MSQLLILLLTSFAGLQQGQAYDYENLAAWGVEYPSCLGKQQSPIDIDEKAVKPAVLPPLQFTGFDSSVEQMNLTNNGHTVFVTVDPASAPTLSGGPLNGTYVFEQLHFHWGPNDQLGSEDSMGNTFYPLELHLVFHSTAYGSRDNALTKPDGLTVMAFFCKLSSEDNANWANFVNGIQFIKNANDVVQLFPPPPLNSLLPSDLQRYYTYPGSLTTPPCSEIVIWLDFKAPITMSHRQLEQFRSINDARGVQITRNYRPQQAKNDRPIYYVAPAAVSPVQTPVVSPTSTSDGNVGGGLLGLVLGILG